MKLVSKTAFFSLILDKDADNSMILWNHLYTNQYKFIFISNLDLKQTAQIMINGRFNIVMQHVLCCTFIFLRMLYLFLCVCVRACKLVPPSNFL